MQKRLTQFLLVLTLLVPTVAFADHNWTRHLLEHDGVYNGESRYMNNTYYYDSISHAVSTWNGLGKVKIFAPSPYSGGYYDFTWEAYSSSTDGLCGYSNAYYGYIKLNTWWNDPASDWNRKSCAAHELGHQLAIGDHGAGYGETALMYGHVGRFISPQQHDKDDYYSKWR